MKYRIQMCRIRPTPPARPSSVRPAVWPSGRLAVCCVQSEAIFVHGPGVRQRERWPLRRSRVRRERRARQAKQARQARQARRRRGRRGEGVGDHARVQRW
ncbi:hypothetical protein DVK44_05985 [Streptomyces paludis]|uniref:Uncharacterized protein n=1 Tax=Streptomyces paludis TaxID=2282738 RepID=A0A345HKT9_9ACTN|nr:hypothetical protein DVK44_05985 [Streptomyces paludis]